MKIRFVVLSLAVVGVSILCLPTTRAQPSKERLIQRLENDENEPVTITDIKVNGQKVSFGKSFIAPDDWLRTLVISMKNKSSKRILFLNFDVFLRYPQGSKDQLATFSQPSFGNAALQRKPPSPSEQLIGLAPGESVEVHLSDRQFSDFQKFLGDLRVPASIDKVELKIGRVIFEDDTMWSGGIFRRDPGNPSNWSNVSP
jgi:hypothetical protein